MIPCTSDSSLQLKRVPNTTAYPLKGICTRHNQGCMHQKATGKIAAVVMALLPTEIEAVHLPLIRGPTQGTTPYNLPILHVHRAVAALTAGSIS